MDAHEFTRRAQSVVDEYYEHTKMKQPTFRDFIGAIHRLQDAVERFSGTYETKRQPFESETRPGISGPELIERHEAFGLVGLYRTSGSTRLFGSHLASHSGYISLKVRRASRHSDSLGDHVFGEGRNLIEVNLSSAQFAQMLTNMNVGEGVPCTIARVEGVRMEPVPDLPTEGQRIREGFASKIEKLAKVVGKVESELAEALEGTGPVSKTKLREVLAGARKATMEIASNVPFVVDQFNRATQKTITHAKAEVEAYTALVFREAGLQAIAAGFVPTLPRSTEDEV